MSALIILAGAALLARGEVPLEIIHSDPARYEGRILKTCGDAYSDRDILFMRNWISGRSRGGMRLNRPLSKHGYVCVRVKVVRAPVVKDAPLPEGVIVIASHPPVIPEGWRLRALKILSTSLPQ